MRTEVTLQQISSRLEAYDIIAFDVFDTLITRRILQPVDVFEVVDASAKQQGILTSDFARDRQQAEQEAYRIYGSCADFQQIYQVLQDQFFYSASQCEALLALELETELNLAVPRRAVRALLCQLLQAGKRIILCSDMYLSSGQIRQLLLQCGYPEDLEIWVSSEKGGTKSSGVLWDKLLTSLPSNQKFIHIGDNPDADYRPLRQRGRDAILISSGAAQFRDSELYGYLSPYSDNLGSRLILGYLVNGALFNSPFSDTPIDEDVISAWGGPTFACFMDFLARHRDDSQLLFVTREGYLLKPMYERYCRQLGIHPQDSSLFYASRAATISATITAPDRIASAMLSPKYRGTLGNLAESRFNFDLSFNPELWDLPISLPEQRKQAFDLLKPYFPEMIRSGQQQQEAYRIYTQSVRQGIKPLTVVDVGYNGTIQYALTQILGEKVGGMYLFLNDGSLPAKNGCPCISLANPREVSHPVYDNLLFLEAVMQAPHGQLQKMELVNGVVAPVFNSDRCVSPQIPRMQESFCSFVQWIAFWQARLGPAMQLDFALAEAIWVCLVQFSCLPQSALEGMWLADDFCGNPAWQYDSKKKQWHNGSGSITPLAFSLLQVGEKTTVKQLVKNIVKRYIPYFAYDWASAIWQRYFLKNDKSTRNH